MPHWEHVFWLSVLQVERRLVDTHETHTDRHLQQADETAWEAGDSGDDSAHAEFSLDLVVTCRALCVHCEGNV